MCFWGGSIQKYLFFSILVILVCCASKWTEEISELLFSFVDINLGGGGSLLRDLDGDCKGDEQHTGLS